MSRRLPALLITAATAVSLAACGSDSSPAESSGPGSSASSSSTPTSAASSSSASSSSAAAPSAAAKPVAVNKTITDPVLGNQVTVLQYIDGYQPSAAAKQKYSALEDEKVVLVQVKATAGTKYYGSVGTGDFRLTQTANTYDETATSILDSEVTAAGYPILEDVGLGKTGTGWIVFTPKKEYTKLVFAYKRLAYKTSDGKTIAAQVYPVPLN